MAKEAVKAADAKVADAVDVIADKGVAALNAVIADGEKASADLRAEREKLVAERTPLHDKLTEMNVAIRQIDVQIGAAEGPEVAKARRGLKAIADALDAANNPNRNLRRFSRFR